MRRWKGRHKSLEYVSLRDFLLSHIVMLQASRQTSLMNEHIRKRHAEEEVQMMLRDS